MVRGFPILRSAGLAHREKVSEVFPTPLFGLGSSSLFGEVTYLETRLEDAQDRVARYHPDNAAV